MTFGCLGAGLARQTALPTSSAINGAPLWSSATPTGRPIALPSGVWKPVTMSCGGPLAILEGHVDHLVAVERTAVLAAMLADKDAAAVALGKPRRLAEDEAKRGDVRA